MAIAVLIVEDQFLLRGGTESCQLMEHSGFTVYEASNADEAIEAHRIAQRHPGGVHRHPHARNDGRAQKLAHYVRGRWPPVKLIITSGYARPPAEDMPVGSAFVAEPYRIEVPYSAGDDWVDAGYAGRESSPRPSFDRRRTLGRMLDDQSGTVPHL